MIKLGRSTLVGIVRSMSTASTKQRFAPLRYAAQASPSPKLKGVIFDMDGTLCLPQNYMFTEMRDALGIPKSVDILEHIESLPESEQKGAHEKIEAIEREAMAKQEPQQGLARLLEYLDSKGIPKGICTRNFDTPVAHLVANHVPSHIKPFAPIITRSFKPPKPSPEGIWHIARAWGHTVDSRTKQNLPLIMVGDSIDDIIAGHDAGAATVLLRSEGKEELERDHRTDVVIDRLDELVDILEDGFPQR